MKNFPLCIVSLCFLFSCSTESDFELSKNLENSTTPVTNEISPAPNKSNPFDVQGKKYYNAIELYLKNNDVPNSIEEISSELSFILNYSKTNNYNKRTNLIISPEEVLLILNDPSNKLLEVVENCSISSQSKAELLVFVQTLIDRQEEQYVTIRDFIISYDNSIIENSVLNADEKESILTVSSISSYVLYAEYERKDRDWENSAGTRMAKPFFDPNQASIILIIALLNQII
jgi:hypothetical protein